MKWDKNRYIFTNYKLKLFFKPLKCSQTITVNFPCTINILYDSASQNIDCTYNIESCLGLYEIRLHID